MRPVHRWGLAALATALVLLAVFASGVPAVGLLIRRAINHTTGQGHTTAVHGDVPCTTATIPLVDQG